MDQDHRPLAWPSSSDWPKGHHDSTRPELSEVMCWIGSAVGVASTDVHLVKCFSLSSWSVTALFQIDNPSSKVVFKAILLELFSKHPVIYDLLQQCCPDAVPEMISHRIEDGGGAWTLFRSIEGKSVKEIGRSSLLVKMAKTMAMVQTEFAQLSDEQISVLPRFGNDRLPEMLEFLIRRIRDYYLPLWEASGGALLKRRKKERMVEIPENFALRLEASIRKIEIWVAELESGGWPESIHHTDYHPGNTIVEPNGNLRIIDWDRSVVSFPFDSIGWLDVISGGSEWQNDSDEKQEPGLSLVDVYLDTIPWNSREDRQRAWDLMRRIGSIADAYESELLNDALHRRNRTGGNIAQLLGNSLNVWESIGE